MIQLLIESTWQTVIMVITSTLIGFVLGIPIGVLLFTTDKLGLFENVWINKTLGFIVNAVRSTPYIILVIALIPFTQLIIGSFIGTAAATVPLSIASVMLYCRIVEDALRVVPKGLIEAIKSMGATRMQIIFKVLVPEALPSLISGLTLIIISLIGFSAMAGVVGGGGLGDLAMRYGYQRYDVWVVVEVIAILIVMVQIVQMTGDFLSRKLRK